MVVMAARTGFSAAFGAFIMGSILAETVEAESIERLVKPVKDLFGAVFFVSVGMMVDPAMIVEYALPIIVITLAVILGQSLFGTLGVLLAGQPLKTEQFLLIRHTPINPIFRKISCEKCVPRLFLWVQFWEK